MAGTGCRHGTDADGENGPATRSFAADAHDCIMVRFEADRPHTSLWRERCALMASSPRIITQTDAVTRPGVGRQAHLAVQRPAACSGVKALRNTSDAKAASRQALLAFRSLDPLRALREPDRRRRDEERPFPLRTKNWKQTANNNQRINCPATGNSPLTGKAPYKSAKLSVPSR